MKYLLIFLLAFLAAITSGAQGVRELQQKLDKSDSDSSRIAAYQALAKHYRYSHVDSAMYYARKGLAYARAKSYALGEGTLIYAEGEINEAHGLLDLAKEQYTEARDIFARIGFKKGVAATTNGLGVVAGRTGQYHEATRHFLEALRLYEQIDATQGVVQTYIKLGVVSDLLGNLDKALEYYLQAESLNSRLPSSNASLSLLNNIGIVYGKRNDIPTALKYFHKGLRESDLNKSTEVHIALLGSLGIAHEKSGNNDSALYYQQQALSLARADDLPEHEARALVNLSSLIGKTDPARSLGFLHEALAITQSIQQLNLMMEVYESMIRLYKDEDNYKQALALSEKRQLLKDSLFSLQKSKEIANLHAHQELAQQENEIKSLALKNETSMMQRNIMIVVAIIAIALICLVWYYNTKVSRLNKRLIHQQGALKDSNTIKDKLFSILGHDLRAPLSRVIGLLNVLGLKQANDDELDLIDKLRQQSLITLETLDNLLLWGQSQLKGIRLNQQTLRVKQQIRKSIDLTADYAAQKNIQVSDKTPADILAYADASHFDFVMRNLLSNAIKFSHTGGAVIIDAYATKGKEILLSIRDSGVGIKKELQNEIFTSGNESVRGTWNEQGTGIALMLCREYIAENGGRLWVESSPGSGSTFYFSLLQKQSSPKAQMETATLTLLFMHLASFFY